MRPIMFRGISYESNQWVYGGFYEWNDKVWIVQKDIWDEPRETKHTISSWLIEVDPKTVGQYTGLKDKNGVEIYEGDKVREGNYKDKIGTVTFGLIGYDSSPNGLNGFVLDHWYVKEEFFYELWYNFNSKELEVIGNIYEGIKKS